MATQTVEKPIPQDHLGFLHRWDEKITASLLLLRSVPEARLAPPASVPTAPTFEGLARFLAELPATDVVGMTHDFFDCPLARYAQTLVPPGTSVLVRRDHIAYTPPGTFYPIAEVPLDARLCAFIRKVDETSGKRSPITAGRAAAILSELFPRVGDDVSPVPV